MIENILMLYHHRLGQKLKKVLLELHAEIA